MKLNLIKILEHLAAVYLTQSFGVVVCGITARSLLCAGTEQGRPPAAPQGGLCHVPAQFAVTGFSLANTGCIVRARLWSEGKVNYELTESGGFIVQVFVWSSQFQNPSLWWTEIFSGFKNRYFYKWMSYVCIRLQILHSHNQYID